MAVVFSSEVSSANSSSMMGALDDVISASSKISSQINSFVTESKEFLKGGGYDAVRNRLNVYSDAFKKQAQLCSILTGNVKSANNTMLNYMEGYTKLNDSELETIKTKLENANRMLTWLEEYSDIWVLDKETKEKTKKKRRNGTDSQIESYSTIIGELEKLVTKLEELSSTDASAFGMISGCEGDVDSFYNCVDGLSTSTFSS